MIADIFRLIFTILFISVYQFNSVAQLCPTLCDSMDCSMPGLPVHHQLPELKLMSIELVMPSNHLILCHPLLLPSIFPASGSFQMSQFFVLGVQSIGGSASVLPVSIQEWFPLGWTGWISLGSKGLSESSPTPHFKSINCSALSFLCSPTLTSIRDYCKNHFFGVDNF